MRWIWSGDRVAGHFSMKALIPLGFRTQTAGNFASVAVNQPGMATMACAGTDSAAEAAIHFEIVDAFSSACSIVFVSVHLGQRSVLPS